MTERTCTACGETKPIEEFYKRQQDPPLYKTACKVCHNAKVLAYQKTDKGKEIAQKVYKKWRSNNLELARKLSREGNKKARAEDPRRFKGYGLKQLYGISIEQYEAMLTAQGNGCAICGAPEPGGVGMFHVDHCHTSSRVRGLLCGECNFGLGKFKDDPKIILAAFKYLTRT